jgi:hypothetical protein
MQSLGIRLVTLQACQLRVCNDDEDEDDGEEEARVKIRQLRR